MRVRAEDAHRSRCRALETEHEPEQGRLAAAVRPGDRDELAGADRERDVLEHPDARPVAERDAVELDDRGHDSASERLLQGGEVRPHDGEVVGAGGDLVVRQPLERVEHRGLDARLARDRLRQLRRDERLEEHGRRPGAPDDVDEARDVPGRRLRLRRQPLEGDLLEAVPLGEVPERRVARHDLRAARSARGRGGTRRRAASSLPREASSPRRRRRAPRRSTRTIAA